MSLPSTSAIASRTRSWTVWTIIDATPRPVDTAPARAATTDRRAAVPAWKDLYAVRVAEDWSPRRTVSEVVRSWLQVPRCSEMFVQVWAPPATAPASPVSSGLPGVSRTALKAVFQAACLAARCSWSASPCVLCPRAEWSRF